MPTYEFSFRANECAQIDSDGGWLDCIFTYEAIALSDAIAQCVKHDPVGAMTHTLVGVYIDSAWYPLDPSVGRFM
jgi:hypothetical protein